MLPLRLVAAGAGAAAAAMILLRWPWLALLPLAVLLPITSGLRLGPLSVTDLLLAAIVGLWFADGARRRTLRLMGFAGHRPDRRLRGGDDCLRTGGR